MKSRIFNIMQYENHPETFEPLLSENQIIVALAHKTIKRYAYIKHDKDHYSEKDFDDDPRHTIDKTKPAHWHIVIECSNAVEIHTIAKWFGIAENFVEVAKGAGAFLDCVEYLTHEETRQQELDKYHYPDEDVKANFDFRDELTKRAERRLKYGKDLDEKDMLLLDIQDHGLTLLQAYRKNSHIYAKNVNLFEKARSTFLSHQNAPNTRINFYVWSQHGGDGKGLASRAIARQFYPDLEDEELMFFVNQDTMFNGYDGQPVIIWNDFRAGDLIRACGGRGNVFDIFDTHPVKQTRNVKYKTISLVNTINIVNSIQNYREFLDGLAGEFKDGLGITHESEDKNQAYRRFPMIIEVRLDSYEYMVNSGFISDEKSYLEFENHKKVRAGFKKLNETLVNNEKLLREFEAKALLPIKNKSDEILERLKTKEITPEQAEEMFKDIGTEIEDEAVPVINDLTESAIQINKYKIESDRLINDLEFKFLHNVNKYVMTEEQRQLILSQPKGADLMYQILIQYGPQAVAISEGEAEAGLIQDE